MQVSNPVEDFASSVYSAIHADLPPIAYQATDWSKMPQDYEGRRAIPLNLRPVVTRLRRPRVEDVSIFSHYQMWGSTALGFGGIGGAAMTNAMTVVVHTESHAAIYWNGSLGYLVILADLPPALKDDFFNSIRTATLDQAEAKKQYGSAYFNPAGDVED